MTARDRRFEAELARRLGGDFAVRTGEVAAYERSAPGVPRPGGERKIGLYVVHHLGGGAKPGSWTWRSIWDFHTKTNGWNTGGYNVCVHDDGRVELLVPPSRMTYGAGPKWNPTTFHIVAMQDTSVYKPSYSMLNSIYRVLCACDDVLGYQPWRPHGAIRQTACPGKYLTPHVWKMAKTGALSPRPKDYPF